jgi:sulfite reductase beta subunit-like hemoprotein
VPETRIIPIIEAVVNVYATHAPPPKRLKFLAAEFGEEKLCQLIEAEETYSEYLPALTGLPENLVTDSKGKQRLELPVFAGQLTADQLLKITDFADAHADGVLMVTTNQQIALQLSSDEDASIILRDLLQSTGLTSGAPAAIRICPGSHECRMGLAATRDVASELLAHFSEQSQNLSWAISGCGNSCSQPQLAEVGIVASRLSADADGQKTPRYDVYRRNSPGFGQKTHESLTKAELIKVVQETA